MKAGVGYDSHRLEGGRRLVMGGVEIEGAVRGLEGHSALLGAAGLGDIGQHFPDTDERWRDAHSIGLLGAVRATLEEAGWAPSNVDATVACEAPTLGPYRDAMRGRLADALGLGPGAVNVKFTTGERLGFVGRGEGIAALAIATVVETAPRRHDAGE